MRQTSDTSGSISEGGISVWMAAAHAYASTLLEPAPAEAAAREALDVVGSTGDAGSDADTVLAVVRHSVARRVPRPMAEPARRGLVRLGRSPRPSPCGQMPELLAARAASLLSPADVDRIAVHLDACEICRDVEDRMARAERTFREVAEHAPPMVVPEAAPEPERAAPTPAPSTWAGGDTHAAPSSAWLPEEVEGVADGTEVTASRTPPPGAATGASAWLIEPDSEAVSQDGPSFAASDWVPDRASAPTVPPVHRPSPPAGRRRLLVVLVPILALLAVAGGVLAGAGVFDGGGAARDSASISTPAQPRQSTAADARERARRAAERRRAERRAARRRAERRAQARRRAAARRPVSAAPVVRTPVATPAPVAPPPPPPPPVQRPTTPTRTTPTRTTPTQTTPSDAPKPSAPSSEPGRQAPPTP